MSTTSVRCSRTTSASWSSSEMRVLLSWLNDYAPFGDDVDALEAALNRIGLAVDAVERVGASIPGIVTAVVVRTERHPDAAKVHRVFVDAGDGHERHVWCGAFNMQAGDVVPLATPGTTMPDGRTIEPRPILGIQSEGMLCSARRARSRRRSLAASSSSRPARRSACRTVRRSGSPRTWCSTSTSPATGPTAGGISAWPATSLLTSDCRSHGRRRRSARAATGANCTGRDRRR